jgi:hypothetical protein
MGSTGFVLIISPIQYRIQICHSLHAPRATDHTRHIRQACFFVEACHHNINCLWIIIFPFRSLSTFYEFVYSSHFLPLLPPITLTSPFALIRSDALSTSPTYTLPLLLSSSYSPDKLFELRPSLKPDIYSDLASP